MHMARPESVVSPVGPFLPLSKLKPKRNGRMEKLFVVRDAMVEQISKLAEEGATFECDLLHSKIADLETAMRIVEEWEAEQRVAPLRTDDLRGECDR